MQIFYLKLNRTGPPITATLTSGGAALDLTGASVRFVMREADSGAIKIDSAATLGDQTATPGAVSYQWQAADVDQTGVFYAEWRATLADGTLLTFPTDDLPNAFIKVIVNDLGASGAYVAPLDLMQKASAAEATDEAVWTDYAVGASRLFDLLTDVEAGFYAAAQASATEKTFYGLNIDTIQLPPHVAGSVSQILINNVAIADAYRVAGAGYDRYLVNLDTDFFDDEEIKITARWGFAEIPADVKLVVAELAIHLWRNRDPHFSNLSGTAEYPDLAPNLLRIIDKYRAKYGTSAF